MTRELKVSRRSVDWAENPEVDLHELLERLYRIIYRQTVKQVEILPVMHYHRGV